MENSASCVYIRDEEENTQLSNSTNTVSGISAVESAYGTRSKEPSGTSITTQDSDFSKIPEVEIHDENIMVSAYGTSGESEVHALPVSVEDLNGMCIRKQMLVEPRMASLRGTSCEGVSSTSSGVQDTSNVASEEDPNVSEVVMHTTNKNVLACEADLAGIICTSESVPKNFNMNSDSETISLTPRREDDNEVKMNLEESTDQNEEDNEEPVPNLNSENEGVQNRFKCNVCEKTYRDKKYLREHVLLHCKRQRNCEFCMKKFPSFKEYYAHITHCEERAKVNKYNCQTCGAIFTTRGRLKYHLPTHLPPGQKNIFKCHFCHKRYLRPKALRDHLFCHIKKPYGCSVCQTYIFSDENNLVCHMISHDIKVEDYKNLFHCNCENDLIAKMKEGGHIPGLEEYNEALMLDEEDDVEDMEGDNSTVVSEEMEVDKDTGQISDKNHRGDSERFCGADEENKLSDASIDGKCLTESSTLINDDESGMCEESMKTSPSSTSYCKTTDNEDINMEEHFFSEEVSLNNLNNNNEGSSNNEKQQSFQQEEEEGSGFLNNRIYLENNSYKLDTGVATTVPWNELTKCEKCQKPKNEGEFQKAFLHLVDKCKARQPKVLMNSGNPNESLPKSVTTSVKALYCPLCRIILSSKVALKKHLLTAHNDLKNTDKTEQEECVNNSETTPKQRDRKTSSQRPRKVKPSSQDIAESIPLECPFCDRVCVTWDQYKTHIKCHEERTFECQECGTLFRRKINLKVHMRIHTDERPFKCKQCDKSFRHDTSLTLHMRRHSGVKPYKCPKCSISFYGNTCLNKHMRRVCFKNIFLCKVCHKEFQSQDELKKHHSMDHFKKKAKIMLETFKCDECIRIFSDRDSLFRHKAIMHGMERNITCDLCFVSYPREEDAIYHCIEIHELDREAAKKHVFDKVVRQKEIDEAKELAKVKAKELARLQAEALVKYRVEELAKARIKAGKLAMKQTNEPVDTSTDTRASAHAQELKISERVIEELELMESLAEAEGVTVPKDVAEAGEPRIVSVCSLAPQYLEQYLESIKPKVIRKPLPEQSSKVDQLLARYRVLIPKPPIPGKSGEALFTQLPVPLSQIGLISGNPVLNQTVSVPTSSLHAVTNTTAVVLPANNAISTADESLLRKAEEASNSEINVSTNYSSVCVADTQAVTDCGSLVVNSKDILGTPSVGEQDTDYNQSVSCEVSTSIIMPNLEAETPVESYPATSTLSFSDSTESIGNTVSSDGKRKRGRPKKLPNEVTEIRPKKKKLPVAPKISTSQKIITARLMAMRPIAPKPSPEAYIGHWSKDSMTHTTTNTGPCYDTTYTTSSSSTSGTVHSIYPDSIHALSRLCNVNGAVPSSTHTTSISATIPSIVSGTALTTQTSNIPASIPDNISVTTSAVISGTEAGKKINALASLSEHPIAQFSNFGSAVIPQSPQMRFPFEQPKTFIGNSQVNVLPSGSQMYVPSLPTLGSEGKTSHVFEPRPIMYSMKESCPSQGTISLDNAKTNTVESFSTLSAPSLQRDSDSKNIVLKDGVSERKDTPSDGVKAKMCSSHVTANLHTAGPTIRFSDIIENKGSDCQKMITLSFSSVQDSIATDSVPTAYCKIAPRLPVKYINNVNPLLPKTVDGTPCVIENYGSLSYDVLTPSTNSPNQTVVASTVSNTSESSCRNTDTQAQVHASASHGANVYSVHCRCCSQRPYTYPPQLCSPKNIVGQHPLVYPSLPCSDLHLHPTNLTNPGDYMMLRFSTTGDVLDTGRQHGPVTPHYAQAPNANINKTFPLPSQEANSNTMNVDKVHTSVATETNLGSSTAVNDSSCHTPHSTLVSSIAPVLNKSETKIDLPITQSQTAMETSRFGNIKPTDVTSKSLQGNSWKQILPKPLHPTEIRNPVSVKPRLSVPLNYLPNTNNHEMVQANLLEICPKQPVHQLIPNSAINQSLLNVTSSIPQTHVQPKPLETPTSWINSQTLSSQIPCKLSDRDTGADPQVSVTSSFVLSSSNIVKKSTQEPLVSIKWPMILPKPVGFHTVPPTSDQYPSPAILPKLLPKSLPVVPPTHSEKAVIHTSSLDTLTNANTVVVSTQSLNAPNKEHLPSYTILPITKPIHSTALPTLHKQNTGVSVSLVSLDKHVSPSVTGGKLSSISHSSGNGMNRLILARHESSTSTSPHIHSNVSSNKEIDVTEGNAIHPICPIPGCQCASYPQNPNLTPPVAGYVIHQNTQAPFMPPGACMIRGCACRYQETVHNSAQPNGYHGEVSTTPVMRHPGYNPHAWYPLHAPGYHTIHHKANESPPAQKAQHILPIMNIHTSQEHMVIPTHCPTGVLIGNAVTHTGYTQCQGPCCNHLSSQSLRNDGGMLVSTNPHSQINQVSSYIQMEENLSGHGEHSHIRNAHLGERSSSSVSDGPFSNALIAHGKACKETVSDNQLNSPSCKDNNREEKSEDLCLSISEIVKELKGTLTPKTKTEDEHLEESCEEKTKHKVEELKVVIKQEFGMDSSGHDSQVEGFESGLNSLQVDNDYSCGSAFRTYKSVKETEQAYGIVSARGTSSAYKFLQKAVALIPLKKSPFE